MTLKNHVPRQGVLPTDWSTADLGTSFNPGLVHQRYAGLSTIVRRGRDAKDTGSNVKIAATTFRDAFRAARNEGQRGLDEQHARLDRAATQQAGWTFAHLDAELASPLAVGLGNVHPMENGLTFHHTLGVPFLPGTSIKGLLRAWCELFGDASPDLLARIFGAGPDDPTGQQRMGALVCLDALPVRWPELDLDLSNCHLQAYYRGPGQGARNPGAVPREDPVPAVFLVVKRGTFRFRLGAPAGIHVDRALTVLTEALCILGIGAKTAAGYGVFKGAGERELTSPIVIRGTPSTSQAPPAWRGGHLFQIFLSHSTFDKARVLDLAVALAQRGAVPWLDLDELNLGDTITETLDQGLVESTAVAALLSPKSLASDWVGEELSRSRELEIPTTPGARTSRVLPVLWGLTVEQLRADGRFADWFKPDGRLDRLVAIEPGGDVKQLATRIVTAAAARASLSAEPMIQIVCDHRGDRQLAGAPGQRGLHDLPTLVFRPGRGERTPKQVVQAEAWLGRRDAMKAGLDAIRWPTGVRGARPRLRLHLRCQLSVAVWLGSRFDRHAHVDVHIEDPKLSSGDRELDAPGLEAPDDREPQLIQDLPGQTLDLVIWHEGKVLDPMSNIGTFRTATQAGGPLWSLRRPFFSDTEDVGAWATSVAAWIQARGKPPVRLYLGCPVFAAVALGRAITRVEASSIQVMEWDFDAETYRACPIR